MWIFHVLDQMAARRCSPSCRGSLSECAFRLALYNSAGVLITNREVRTPAVAQTVTINAILGAGDKLRQHRGHRLRRSGDDGLFALRLYRTLHFDREPAASGAMVAYRRRKFSDQSSQLGERCHSQPVDTAASINNNIAGAQLITLDAPITIGRLIILATPTRRTASRWRTVRRFAYL